MIARPGNFLCRTVTGKEGEFHVYARKPSVLHDMADRVKYLCPSLPKVFHSNDAECRHYLTQLLIAVSYPTMSDLRCYRPAFRPQKRPRGSFPRAVFGMAASRFANSDPHDKNRREAGGPSKTDAPG